MLNLQKLFIELLEDARKQNSESESVKVFDKLINNFNFNVNSTIKDVECNDSNNVFYNDTDALSIFEAIDNLKSGNIQKAIEVGVSDNIELNYDLNSNISICFDKSISIDIGGTSSFHLSLEQNRFSEEPVTKEQALSILKSKFSQKPVLGVVLDLIDFDFIENEDLSPTSTNWLCVDLYLEGDSFVLKDLLLNCGLNLTEQEFKEINAL